VTYPYEEVTEMIEALSEIEARSGMPMSTEPPRCQWREEVRELRCDRPQGHPGAHVQDDGWAQIGWGFNLDASREVTDGPR
jgi:hypothetical protein